MVNLEPSDLLVDINNDWSEPSRCSLTVGPPRPSKASRERPPWELLRDIIDKDNEIFVYSVGPKNDLQRISTATQLDQTLALEGGGRAGVSGETAQGAATFQQQVNRKRGEIENHALILPIGDGISVSGFANPIAFAWAISPRVQSVFGEPVQVDGTYSLSAVVSVPSWWRSLRAQYRTCWSKFS